MADCVFVSSAFPEFVRLEVMLALMLGLPVLPLTTEAYESLRTRLGPNGRREAKPEAVGAEADSKLC